MPMRFDEHGFAEWVEPTDDTDPFDEFDSLDLHEEIVHLNLGKTDTSMANKNKRRGGKKNRRPQRPKASANTGLVVQPLPESAKKLIAEREQQRAGGKSNVNSSYDDDWWDAADFGLAAPPATKAVTPATKPATTVVGGPTYGKGYAGGTTYTSKCRHYNFEDSEGFDIKGIKFFPSSMNNQRKDDDLIPDWGLYLDWGWKHPDWRAENIDWRDYGLPSNYVIAFEAMVEVVERATRGEKVEIGCIGGHGRTGTALACIAVILGMEPKEAIKHVRTGYCSHTLETDEQEWFVSWCYAALHDLPIPPMPEKKYKAPATTYSAPVCNMHDHFYMWLRDAKICTRASTCTTFKPAYATFDKGVPNWLIMTETLEWHKTNAKAYKTHPGNPKNNKTKPAGSPAPSTSYSYSAPAKTTPPPLPVSTPRVAAAQTKPVPTKHVVNGYLVPMPGPKETAHVMNKTDCGCDVCRYNRAGHGAFLEPYGITQGAMHIKQMDEMEQRAERNIRMATIKEAAKNDDKVLHRVYIATHDKGVVQVIVDSNFPVPPTEDGTVDNERRKPSANGTSAPDFQWRADKSLWAYNPLGMKD